MMTRALFALLFATVMAGPLNAAPAAMIDRGLERALRATPPDNEVAVIVRFAGKPALGALKDIAPARRKAQLIRSLRQKAAESEAPLRQFLRSRAVGKPRSLWLINGLAVKLPARLVEQLRLVPGVERVTLDATLAAPTPQAGGTAPAEWNLTLLGAQQLWQQGFTGQGVVVASLDTGVDAAHPDLGSRWRGGNNSWYDPSGEYASPHDANGHGTQTMGLILGGNQSGTAIGVAPGAQWIAARIFDSSGSASYSNIHLAFQWLLDPDGNPDVDDAPDVVSNAWGLADAAGDCVSEFQGDIDALRAAGIAVAFSAGNSGPAAGSSLSPANYAQVLSVGAVDEFGTVPGFSSRGISACDGTLFPTVAAPGVNVTTTDLTFGGLIPDAYISVSGTSFAVAQVAGGMALLKSALAQSTASEIESVLASSSVDIDAVGGDNNSGHGLVDLVGAHTRLQQLLQPGSLQFSAEGYSVREEGAQVSITLTRAGGSSGAVSVDYYTSDGSALGDLDYTPAFGTLNFADGEMSRSFSVPLIDDLSVEGDESLELRLGVASGGAITGWPDSAVLTIIDNESPAPVDSDGDGYPANLDCNDSDPAIYPGAAEIRHDGLDQDCNGYDLTIEILRTEYKPWNDKLIAEATSALGGAAQLELQGYGPMFWDETRGTWLYTTKGVGGNPGNLTVSGLEGAVQAGSCKDTGPGVYPGAPEIKHDGIDQDCNGYDLTIDIIRAEYRPWGDKLIVEATSALGYSANLRLDGHGTMLWSAARGTWLLAVKGIGGNPGSVSVSGLEGREQATVP
jgi:bacillopeptidase F